MCGRRREPPTLRSGQVTERTTVGGIAARFVILIDPIQGNKYYENVVIQDYIVIKVVQKHTGRKFSLSPFLLLLNPDNHSSGVSITTIRPLDAKWGFLLGWRQLQRW